MGSTAGRGTDMHTGPVVQRRWLTPATDTSTGSSGVQMHSPQAPLPGAQSTSDLIGSILSDNVAITRHSQATAHAIEQEALRLKGFIEANKAAAASDTRRTATVSTRVPTLFVSGLPVSPSPYVAASTVTRAGGPLTYQPSAATASTSMPGPSRDQNHSFATSVGLFQWGTQHHPVPTASVHGLPTGEPAPPQRARSPLTGAGARDVWGGR
eukprot:GDKI01006897.1.p1 GENE.GDKI01006897.1~~GDKI01006897.1.p1  ORF type:complete len:211 (-),score=29.34 GDKI01006897.1:387-1019(-)